MCSKRAVIVDTFWQPKRAAHCQVTESSQTGTAKDFHAFAQAGRKLADLHVGYESVKPFKLTRIENPEVPPNWRVEVMKLTKEGDAVFYNDWLTLHGLPPAAHEYRLGNRSALVWVIDQYRVDRDADGEITSEPNPPDDEEAIVRLLGQVVTVSVETMKLVKGLPELLAHFYTSGTYSKGSLASGEGVQKQGRQTTNTILPSPSHRLRKREAIK